MYAGGVTRRAFLAAAAAAPAAAQIPGERPARASGIEVLNPRARVPLSIIIDDSTCLVNLNKFAVPQFAAAADGKRYFHDWKSWPDEIPDDFVREFIDWAGENGVKGKYSVVPFPACVGRLDRGIPGWSRSELQSSLRLVRDRVSQDWDIHPEMVTHTRAVDVRTGHPFPQIGEAWMENWGFSVGKSVDELAEYFRYALQILHNVDLPCEGLTTPGGFGTKVLPELSRATAEACRDVYQAEVPHYFRHLYDRGEQSVAPRVEYASGLGGDDPRCAVSIIGCTGDWTGGWDNADEGHLERFITADLSAGRMVDVIERGEPAIMVCHWTGIYWNGRKIGLKIFREVVRRLHAKYDHLIWMKLSEIARYWAAKELTAVTRSDAGVQLQAPFACPGFTVAVERGGGPVSFDGRELREVGGDRLLEPGTWTRRAAGAVACFDLPRGASRLRVT